MADAKYESDIPEIDKEEPRRAQRQDGKWRAVISRTFDAVSADWEG